MGFTDEHVLKMPARRFFAMNRARMDLEYKERNANYFNLCEIQSVSGVNSLEYYNEVRSYYRDSFLDEAPKKLLEDRKNRIFNADDPESSKYAANVLKSYFKAAGH